MGIKIFYDGKCHLCSKEINYYKSIDKENRFSWLDISEHHKALSDNGIALSDALLYLHALDDEDNLKIGIDAFILIWNNLPGWKTLAWLTTTPLIKSIANRTYKAFANYRFNRLDHCKVTVK